MSKKQKKVDIRSNQKIVTEDDVKRSGGNVYDRDIEPFLSREDLPNPGDILDNVIRMLEVMLTAEMKVLKNSNSEEYEKIMEDKFPDFSMKYYGLFKMVLSGEDITPLFGMLAGLADAKKGTTTLDVVEKNIGKELSKFLPDKIKR